MKDFYLLDRELLKLEPNDFHDQRNRITKLTGKNGTGISF